MLAIEGVELIHVAVDAEVVGELDDASATVAAHAAFAAVGVVIFHFEIEAFFGIEQHEAVGADAETTVAQPPDLVQLM